MLVCGLVRFPEGKRNVNAAVVEKHFLVEDARIHSEVLVSGKEALALVMCIEMDH